MVGFRSTYQRLALLGCSAWNHSGHCYSCLHSISLHLSLLFLHANFNVLMCRRVAWAVFLLYFRLCQPPSNNCLLWVSLPRVMIDVFFPQSTLLESSNNLKDCKHFSATGFNTLHPFLSSHLRRWLLILRRERRLWLRKSRQHHPN